VLAPPYVILLNQVCSLASVKTSDNVQSLIVKSNRGVEVSARI